MNDFYPDRGTYKLSFDGSTNFFRPKSSKVCCFYCWPSEKLILMTSSAKYDDVIKKFKTSYIFFDPCLMYNKTAKFDGVWAKTSGDNRVGKFTHSPHREKMPIYFVRDCSFRLLLTFLCSLSVCLLSGLSLTSNCLLIGWAETVRCLICWMLELT